MQFATVLNSCIQDMKNSLSVQLSSIDALIKADQRNTNGREEHLMALPYEASRMNGELTQLLTLYQLQQNSLQLHIDECYVRDLFEEQVARNDLLLRAYGVSVRIECDSELNWFLDQDQIGNIIHNILVNCIRYTDKHIKLSARLLNGELHLTVEDDGPGYPISMIEMATSFAHGDTRLTNSAGMGLYFAYEIARLHSHDNRRGSIAISNSGGLGGGVFTLRLP